MFARIKHLPIYILAIAACYFVAWTVSFVFVNGAEFAFYFDYLAYFWKSGGGERPFFTGMISIALTVPLSLLAVWLLRRGFKAKEAGGSKLHSDANEKTA